MKAEVDISHIRLETQRLILRPWEEKDLEDLFSYASVDGVGQMAGWPPHKTIEESRQILDMFIADKKTFALELKENGRVIGSLGIEEPHHNFGFPEDWKTRELGYVLAKSYWGRGLMPEAVKAAMDYCFDTLQCDYLTCGHFTTNQQSCRVIEKTGFVFLTEYTHNSKYLGEVIVRMYAAMSPARENNKLEKHDV